jgi:glutamyl-tRNA(Gln) amidotransferase subunit E
MHTPEEAVEVDREIGRILRATGRVRRGIGTVRQDVNVSIRGGTRVEIKGVPRTGIIESLVHYEGVRQRSLLSLKDIISARKIDLRAETADCTDLFQDSTALNLRNVVRRGGKVEAVKICRFAGLLHYNLTPNRTFADELKGRVRVIACIDDDPIFTTSEDHAPQGPAAEDWKQVRVRLKAGRGDAVIVVGGPAEDVSTALSEIQARVFQAADGVQPETRQVLKGGETGFERILPGPDRMYPDTDSAPIPIPVSDLRRIKKQLPVLPEDWRKKYGDMLKPETINQLIDMDRIEEFGKLFEKTGCDPKLLAYTLTSVLPAMRRQGYDTKKISKDDLVRLFRLYRKGGILREKIIRTMKMISEGMKIDSLLFERPGRSISMRELRKIVKEAEKIELNVQDAEKKRNFLIGYIKKKMKNRAGGREISEVLYKRAVEHARGDGT